MARLPRLYAPGIPQLIQSRFARPFAGAHEVTPAAQLDLLQGWLANEARNHAVALHGWVILPDRIVALATPDQPQGISRAVQGMGRRIAARLTHSRAYEGRYRNTLVDDPWVPACLVWLESLPVRQRLVEAAAHWPWSSAQEHVGLRMDAGLLSDHPAYWQLGDTPFARQARYQNLLLSGVSRSDSERIEQALFGQWALGDDTFLERLATRSSRRVAPVARGRPRKAAA